jgi:hypothetical protein
MKENTQNVYRQEVKYHVESTQYGNVIEHLKANEWDELYPERQVLSLYFDTSKLDMYLESEEGLFPRKKFRYRTYINDLNIDDQYWTNDIFIGEVKKEEKTSLPYCRSKNTETINVQRKNLFQVVDPQYGVLFPISVVRYNRRYYVKDSIRITIDSNIRYHRFGWGHYSNATATLENGIILEAKGDMQTEIIDHAWLKTLKRKRFSKYCRAIDRLFYNDCIQSAECGPYELKS